MRLIKLSVLLLGFIALSEKIIASPTIIACGDTKLLSIYAHYSTETASSISEAAARALCHKKLDEWVDEKVTEGFMCAQSCQPPATGCAPSWKSWAGPAPHEDAFCIKDAFSGLWVCTCSLVGTNFSFYASCSDCAIEEGAEGNCAKTNNE